MLVNFFFFLWCSRKYSFIPWLIPLKNRCLATCFPMYFHLQNWDSCVFSLVLQSSWCCEKYPCTLVDTSCTTPHQYWNLSKVLCGYNKVLLGYQLGQVIEQWKNQHFEDNLCPPPPPPPPPPQCADMDMAGDTVCPYPYQHPEDKDRGGLWNVGLFAIQPFNPADSLGELDYTHLPGKHYILPLCGCLYGYTLPGAHTFLRSVWTIESCSFTQTSNHLWCSLSSFLVWNCHTYLSLVWMFYTLLTLGTFIFLPQYFIFV